MVETDDGLKNMHFIERAAYDKVVAQLAQERQEFQASLAHLRGLIAAAFNCSGCDGDGLSQAYDIEHCQRCAEEREALEAIALAEKGAR